MIQTVLKRDGRVVGFNEEKIATAIRKAMLHTDKGEDLQLIHQITGPQLRTSEHRSMYSYVRLSSIDVQLRTSEHRSMYSYVRLSIRSMYTSTLSIDRSTATYV